MIIPTLQSSRLILRPFALADFDAYAAIRADENVGRWTIGGKPLTRAEAWPKFLQHPGHWALMGYGFWAVEEKATGAMIGEAGFIDMQRDYDPKVNGVPEIGWIIAPAAQGKGYATEAAKAAIAWGAPHFGPIRVIAAVNVENIASIRVAQKCGFKECLRRDFNGRAAVFLDRVL
jgi:RimJ/RimL family protein N-acetyltransferase